MISDITGLDYNILKDNIEIKNNNSKPQSTFLIEFDKEDNIIIEINKESYARNLIKNIICIFLGIETKKEKDDKNIKLIQIHINKEKNAKKALSKYRIKEYIKDSDFQNILCIEISPQRCKEKYNNNEEIDNSIKWGVLLQSKTEKEIKEIIDSILTKKVNKK